ncbi:MAG: hypothetical protein VX475_17570, partial [Myxococcota bacterium]|nr:hypothetical protein [Myxococcota bacterium]
KAGYITIDKRFSVSMHSVRRWVKQFEETGSLEVTHHLLSDALSFNHKWLDPRGALQRAAEPFLDTLEI